MAQITGEAIERAKAPFYLLWQRRTPLLLTEDIRDAAAAWRAKYGTDANTVYMHPSCVPEGGLIVMEGCEVRPRDGVRPGTLWCGWEARA